VPSMSMVWYSETKKSLEQASAASDNGFKRQIESVIIRFFPKIP
jgi:hypothetical protein